jgi:hypothetical protein
MITPSRSSRCYLGMASDMRGSLQSWERRKKNKSARRETTFLYTSNKVDIEANMLQLAMRHSLFVAGFTPPIAWSVEVARHGDGV